jgi:hypothetical protein
MGVRPDVVLRASSATRRDARALGWRVHRTMPTLIRTIAPALIVIDEPSAVVAARWASAARDRRIPVVSICDFGIGRTDADLTIDGSLIAAPDGKVANLQGPDFAILDPRVAELRRHARPRASARVIITLGGGSYVRGIGLEVATAIRVRSPQVEVELAPGFGGSRLPALPEGCRWIDRHALRHSLATASVAVVSGGITLYEACALGTPIVTLPVTKAQRLITAAVAARGAAIDTGAVHAGAVVSAVEDAVQRLITHPADASALGAAARRLVDGRGISRVTAHLKALVTERAAGRARDAA